ncbi:jacalin-related lectin 34-like isoform X3 [Benincasa hispida]|uniref:jacalin-related lectin 34-like isoform X3 n=1 Tax=Benincasa hispida TaxID=102211 RepID=UPI001900DB8C|nr:jacalin-related lectin 34-like isoform X3 [Benincasa hispida]
MTVKLPAHGSKRGSVWNDGVHEGVKRLEIIHDDEWVCGVRIEYIDKNGKAEWGLIHGQQTRHGYSDHSIKQAIEFPSPCSDFLTSIHGYTEYSSIKSLTFETISGRTYGPYGDQEGKGTKFSIPLRAAKIVGFHGRSDEHSLNAIGVYVQPITNKQV